MKSRSGTSGSEVLPDDYYVSAFLNVLDVVIRSHAPVLNTRELAWADAIRNAGDGARRLYIRLLGRRGNLFRLGKLNYPEIDDPPAAAAELVVAGLASDRPPTSLEALLGAFTLPEIATLVDSPAALPTGRVARVRALVERDAPGDAVRLAAADRWLAPCGHECFEVFRLCFFGNLRQDLSEFVLTDLGAVRYETCELSVASRHFRSRAQIEAHLRFHECETLFALTDRREVERLGAILVSLPDYVERDAHLERRMDRLRIEIARCFERIGELERALEVYAATRRAPAREREIRLLVKLGRTAQAIEGCRSMASKCSSEAEAEFVARTLAKLERPSGGRRSTGRLVGRLAHRPFKPAATTLTLTRGAERVECAARSYYERDGRCFWLENRLATGVLGLFAWDIVFAPLPGAFFNPFQAAPVDYRERGFRNARRELVEARLAELEGIDAGENLQRRLSHTLAKKRGIANPLVHWETLSTEALSMAVERIPPAHWRALFDRMLDDLSEHTNGLPDLVRFPSDGGYELIEIKGPGDALQQHQRRWFAYFARHGIPARVVNVRWRDVAAGGAAAIRDAANLRAARPDTAKLDTARPNTASSDEPGERCAELDSGEASEPCDDRPAFQLEPPP